MGRETETLDCLRYWGHWQKKEISWVFWTAAKAFGDPFAELALGFHDELRGSNWKTRVAIRRLEESVVSRESSGRSRYTRLSDEKLGRLKVNIGVALIEGHLEALKADIEDNVGEEGRP